ncbi:MAG: hypothetical protein O8C67_05005 [Candidatus Methanoperedens sp.]|nr:hypothetical protein [Candidatus Methanoperedens sp.]
MNDIVTLAIQEFIKDTGSKTEISLLTAKIDKMKKPSYKKVTYDLSKVDINNQKAYPILKIKGMGKITELSILTDAKPKIEIYLDGRHMFNLSVTPYDDLKRITSFSKDITAQDIPPNYAVSVRNLGFRNSFMANVYFDNRSNILGIYGKYDLCEEI